MIIAGSDDYWVRGLPGKRLYDFPGEILVLFLSFFCSPILELARAIRPSLVFRAISWRATIFIVEFRASSARLNVAILAAQIIYSARSTC